MLRVCINVLANKNHVMRRVEITFGTDNETSALPFLCDMRAAHFKSLIKLAKNNISSR